MANLPYSPYNVTDKAIGALNAGISNVDASLVLQSGQGAKFPSANFCVYVEDEIVYVLTRTTDTFSTLTRGYNGSTAASHLAGARVVLPFTQAHYQRINDNLLGHTHAKADIADFAHTHPQADITNLVTDLAAKEVTSAKGQANGYAGLDGTGKVPSAQLPASGSDPWTVIKLASDFTTSSATAVDITGLAFTPAANTAYMFEALLLCRTASATINPRPGLAWATGLTDGVVSSDTAQTATTRLMTNGNTGAAVLTAVGGLPNTTQSWPCTIWGTAIAGASPSGTVKLQLASETAGTNVTVKTGSYLRYRTY